MRLESLRARTALVLLSSGLLIALAFAGLWIYSTYDAAKNEISQANLQDARLLSNYLSSYLHDVTSDEVVAAHFPDTLEAIQQNNKSQLSLIGVDLAGVSGADLVVILDAQGNVLYHSRGANTTEFVKSGWFDRMVLEHAGNISSLYHSDSLQEYVFSVAYPVRDAAGSVAGYIFMSFRASQIDGMIESQHIDPARNVFVVDGQGRVVAVNANTSFPRYGDLSPARSVQQLKNGTDGLVYTSQTYDGQRRIVGFAHVPDSGGWGAIVSTPVTVIYWQIFERILLILALFGAGCLILLLSSLYLSRYLTDPIVGLASTMRRISQGSYRERAQADRKDEVGDLSRTFNAMMDELERTVELEHVVELTKRYRLIFLKAKDPIFFTAIDGRIIDANPAASQAYGYTHGEMLAMAVADFRIPEERPKIQNTLQLCYDKGCVYDTVHVRKNGSTFPAEISSAGTLIEDRKVIVAIIRDITERKQAEEERLRLARNIELLLESTDEGIAQIDAAGTCVLVNKSATAMLGYGSDELLGKPLHPLIHHTLPDGTPCLPEQCGTMQALKTGRSLRVSDQVFWRKDGTPFPVEYSSSPIKDTAGAVLGVVMTFLDITERRQAEQAIEAARRQAEKERELAQEETQRAELYLDIMGHDINNLNQVAIMNLEMARDEPGLAEETREPVEAALRATQSSSAIIENVRTLQRITVGRLEPEVVDVNGMILSCIAEAPRPAGKKVGIEYRQLQNMLVVGVPLLKEAFCNLINNSIKYSGEVVTIEIGAEEIALEGKKYYRITVSDDGYGIPDEVKPRIFARFQRGTTKAHGKGLGLYIVRTLLEKFGGSVTVEDRVPGDYSRGTRFTVILPAAEPDRPA